MKVLTFFLILFTAVFAQQTRNISCEFALTVHGYSCSLDENLQGIGNVNILPGNHQQDRNNSDVIGFALRSSNLNFFPLQAFELFPNLENVDFSSGQIPVLESNVFANRFRLQLLNLHSSGITIIQAGAFDGLTGLHTLTLHSNPILSLPRGIFDSLISLRTLDLFSTGITRLEANLFTNTRSLNVLNLQDNEIRNINRNIFENTRELQVLRLEGNPCGSGADLNFSNIQNGDISLILPQLSRCFGVIPVTCEFTNNTQVLGISAFNYTCTVEDQKLEESQRNIVKEFGGNHLMNLGNEDVINLRINYSKIPFFLTEIFTTFHKLRAIEITNGGLQEIRSNDFLNGGNLESVYMQYNNLTVLNGGIFARLSNLQKLSLGKNEIERIDGNAFSGLTALRLLYLQDNRITRLNRNTFNSLFQLQDLNLSRNYLSRISGLLFFNNRNVGVIMLDSNQISAIDESFLEFLPRLAVLNLLYNRCVSALYDGNRNRINEGLKQCYEEYEKLQPDRTRQVIMEIDGEVGLIGSDGRRIVEL